DVKELYYYLDNTPTHSYMKALYKYPQAEFPYAELEAENARRGVFVIQSGKSPNDILGRYTVVNRGPERATVHVLPQLWYRNVWDWGDDCEEVMNGPVNGEAAVYRLNSMDNYVMDLDCTHNRDLHDGRGFSAKQGLNVQDEMRLYTSSEAPPGEAFTEEFENIFKIRINEADMFYDEVIPTRKKQEQRIARQAYAGLLWSKQFYYYILKEWLRGDSNQPPPPPSRALWGRNKDWTHLFNRDVVSMPDKWEYPWYASWDLAFHMIAMSRVDIQFAKAQLVLLLREWYMHPNGQIPAYEFAFDDVNPPVHAYAVLRIYKFSGLKGTRDEQFLARCFHKLVLNFTWWVNRKDIEGKNIFSGGFLGLDNIGVFDRSKPLPGGGFLAQADASAWMGFFCSIMLEMSLLLASREPIYQDMASKFFEHFVSIVDAMNHVDGVGLWDETDGFFYDHVRNNHLSQPVKIKSMVGLIPLCCALVLEDKDFRKHPGFAKRTKWFIENCKDLSKGISLMTRGTHKEGSLLLSIVNREKIIRILGHMLDEKKFLSPYGIRSLSKKEPFTLHLGGGSYSVKYEPGESESKLFGGNSNWRGPIWLPMNYLIIENLRRYDDFFGDELKVECPTGSGVLMRLGEIAQVLERRLINLFLPDANGKRPCHGKDEIYATDPHFKHLCLFYEYFHGDTGRGCGASHQTGWTALIANILEKSTDVEEGYDSADDLEFFD
ncbi:hypothetical protein DPMN_008832, partial [Dreissena polymorpha]